MKFFCEGALLVLLSSIFSVWSMAVKPFLQIISGAIGSNHHFVSLRDLDWIAPERRGINVLSRILPPPGQWRDTHVDQYRRQRTCRAGLASRA